MRDVVRWQVGVLRSGQANIAWSVCGEEPGWARAATIAAVHEFVAIEGVHEYRLRIDDAEGIVNPARSIDGELMIGDLERLIPADRNAA